MAINLGPATVKDCVISQINTTTVVNVMLMLLIVLLIMTQVPLHTVIVTPKSWLVKPQHIGIGIDSKSSVKLETRIRSLVQLTAQPEIYIRPHKKLNYATFAHVFVTSKGQGLHKMVVIGSEQYAAGAKAQ